MKRSKRDFLIFFSLILLTILLIVCFVFLYNTEQKKYTEDVVSFEKINIKNLKAYNITNSNIYTYKNEIIDSYEEYNNLKNIYNIEENINLNESDYLVLFISTSCSKNIEQLTLINSIIHGEYLEIKLEKKICEDNQNIMLYLIEINNNSLEYLPSIEIN